jgi:hypothetical protein
LSVAISALSRWVTGEWIVKALLVAGFVLGWLGMARLVRRHGAIAAHAAGAVFALSPLLLTRAGVGHLSVTLAAAALPWALPSLTRPGRDLRATFTAASALGFSGPFGGSIAVLIAVVSILCGAHRRAIRGLIVTLFAQVPWAVAVGLYARDVPIDTNEYRTNLSGLTDIVGVSAGRGFWLPQFQVGGSGALAFTMALVLLFFAWFGSRDLPRHLHRPMIVLGLFGWLATVVSSVRLFDGAVDAATSNVVTSIWREPQRLAVLHLVWLAPAAVLGAVRIGRGFHDCRVKLRLFLKLMPVVAAGVLALPGVWGLDGQLKPVTIPTDWVDAKVAIDDEPGTVLALPWAQYVDLGIAGQPTRLMKHPLPTYLGGDVISSVTDRDPMGVPGATNLRNVRAEALVARLSNGESISEALADLGIRWVVLLKDDSANPYGALLNDDGLSSVTDGDSIVAFKVDDWKGPAVTSTGRSVAVKWLAPGVARVDSSKQVDWNWPGQPGWQRGRWGKLTIADDGRLTVPAGRGVVWQPRVLAVAASQGVWVLALLLGLGSLMRSGVAGSSRSVRRRRSLGLPRLGQKRFDTWDSLIKSAR